MKTERFLPAAEYREVLSYFLRIALPLLSLSLLAFLLYFILETSYEKQLNRGEQEQQVQLSVRSLQRDISGVVRELQYLSGNDNFRRFITSGKESDRRVAEREMAQFVRFMKRYDQVRWLDQTGREQLRVDYKSGAIRIVPPQELQDKASRYYFTEAMKLPPRELYVSPLDLNMEHGQVQVPYRPMLRFAMPTADEQGRKNGLLILNYSASRMLEDFAKSKRSDESQLYLLNADGYWLYASDDRPEWGFMFGQDERFQSDYPKVWAAFARQTAGAVPYENKVITFSAVTIPTFLEASASAMGEEGERKGGVEQQWYVVSVCPRPAILSIYLKHAALYSLLIALVTLVLVLISWVLARTLKERNHLIDRLGLHAKVMETATNGVIIADAKTHIVAVNKAFTSLTGYTEKEVLGKSPSVLSSGRHDEGFFADMWKTLGQKDYWEGEIWNRHKNGEVFPDWLSISAVRNAEGELTNYIGIFSRLSVQKSTSARLRELASTDPLTGLVNRNLLYDRAGMALAHGHRTRTLAAFLFLDLDRFKPINDTLGHAAGDQVLKVVAKRLKGCVRESDTVARFGGDEFMVLLSDLKTTSEAMEVAEKIIRSVSKPIAVGEEMCQVGVSIGISIFPEDGESVDELVSHADSAMYRAKKEGKGHGEFYRGHE